MSEEELPEGWAEALMSEVTADVPSQDPTDDPDRMFAYIDISAIDNRSFTITSDEVKRFPGRAAPSRARRPVRPGDVLYSNVRTYLRNIALVPAGVPADLCSTGFTVLRSNGAIEPGYLFRWVLTEEFLQRISPHETGTHYPATSDRAVRALSIRVPPFAEQRRIVEKVEVLLAEVNAARARLSKVPTILKRFCQSILSAACSGRLSEDFQTGGVEWATGTVDSVCDVIVDCPHSTPKWSQSGRICLRTTNFTTRGLDLSEVRYVDGKTFEERAQRLRPCPGDVVYSREGGILGIACVLPDGLDACLGQRMMLMRPNCTRMAARFLEMVLNSPATLATVRELTGGTASPHLNVGDIKAFVIPLPPIAEQHEVVRRVDALFKLADAIEARVAAATARADKLTQAILAKAFRGELVPTEAELAREEGRTYEPAAALLARIRTERETQASAPKPRAQRTGSRSGGQPEQRPVKRAQSGHGKRGR